MDRYHVTVTYQDKTRVRTAGTWNEVTEWLSGENPGGVNPAVSVRIDMEGNQD
jgi:hypothetical protein